MQFSSYFISNKHIAWKIFLFSLCFISCNKQLRIESVGYNLDSFKNHIIQVDLTDALSKGVEIPTPRQTPSGYFKISFHLDEDKSKKYFYKIYYQNESYKFPEQINNSYNNLAGENFYGSWESDSIGFKPVSNASELILDSIKIVGNPRNEEIYYGDPFEKSFYSEQDINDEIEKIKGNKKWLESVKAKAIENNLLPEEQLAQDAKWILKTNSDKLFFTKGEINNEAELIKNDKKWYDDIKTKAKKNNISAEKQLVLDAKWVLANNPPSPKQNNRWKRNPRMGRYSIMIVVAEKEDLNKIPNYIQHINLVSDSGDFINPYYYFNNKKILDSLHSIFVFRDTSFITAKASLDISSGIYASELDYPGSEKIPDSGGCGGGKELYYNAQFAQFFSALSKNLHLNTIPLIQDVTNSSYSQQEYDNAFKKYSEKDLKKDYIRNTDKPCQYVRYNASTKAIEIINPGNKDLANAHKTNMGVKTRIGFTYGKITAKIKFPELINKYNVWNGLTDAFWLLFQDENKWDDRRICKTGYTAKGNNSDSAARMKKTYYSEIDFEMVKTSKYWTKEYYKNRKDVPSEDSKNDDNIIVACTNWDMTCKDCKKYTVGIDTTHFQNNFFETNRWYSSYQALTTRTAEKDDELFKRPYYYYQFEWTPTKIIWRIGPEKDKLKVVGYMDENNTSIPNNQMIAVLTQEYHLSEWWPPIPFKQEYIPYPKNDIKGELYELTIE